jgi:hypothetical protein
LEFDFRERQREVAVKGRWCKGSGEVEVDKRGKGIIIASWEIV